MARTLPSLMPETPTFLPRPLPSSLLFRLAALGLCCLAACSGSQGRVVSPEYLAGYEGGGSLSTLWYQGSDEHYHHFRHLNKQSTPYRIRRSDMPWPGEFPLGSESLDKTNSLVRNEFSEFLESQGTDR